MATDENLQKLIDAEKAASALVTQARQEADRLTEQAREDAERASAEAGSSIAKLRTDQDAELRREFEARQAESQERIRQAHEAIDRKLADHKAGAVEAVMRELTEP